MEDSAIIDLYFQRSDRAIAETARKFGAYCRSIATRILHNDEDVEEVLNDTYLHTWNSIPPERPQPLSTYLGRFVRWTALTRLRERSSLKRGGGEVSLALDELAETLDSGECVERTIEQQELSAAISRFLSTLEEDTRLVFLARYWYLCPIAEIAQRFGFTQGKVKTLLFRTRGKLRTYLEEEGLC